MWPNHASACPQAFFWEEDFEINEPGGLRYRRLQDPGLLDAGGVNKERQLQDERLQEEFVGTFLEHVLAW